jgi:hypothetical protein
MNNIEKIRDLDEEIFEEFKIYSNKVLFSKFSTRFPSTAQLSNSFTISTNFIKNSIFDCSETDDFFGVKILFRSLIEHYLRFSFIWFNWMKTKSDYDAKRYLDFTHAREVLDTIKADIDSYKLSNPDFKIDNWNELLSQIPSCKNLSKKEIEEETLKYTYKNIIKLLKEIDEGKKDTTPFGSLIKEYSKLSSFVHGGSNCHDELLKFHDEEERQQEYNRICSLTFQMAGTVKLFSLLMLVQTDRHDFENSYLNIDRIIKKV